MANAAEILKVLRANANPANRDGMARYGINIATALGVSIPFMRKLARSHRRDHALALALWDTGVHEARILASLVDDPARVTATQMDAWVRAIDSWDVCDQVCNNLFNRTRFAWRKARQWHRQRPEFARRAGFVLMATLAVHDKEAGDADFDWCFEAHPARQSRNRRGCSVNVGQKGKPLIKRISEGPPSAKSVLSAVARAEPQMARISQIDPR
jgi:3-methyladenine DNA glycosylase AlkD